MTDSHLSPRLFRGLNARDYAQSGAEDYIEYLTGRKKN